MLAKGTVFIVDDGASLLDSLTRLLGAAEFEIQGFNSAIEFLNDYTLTDNACLLLDIMTPRMDGFTLQREFATRQIQIPVIFITGDRNVKPAVEAMKAGAFDVLGKPFRYRELIGSVREALASPAIEQRFLAR